MLQLSFSCLLSLSLKFPDFYTLSTEAIGGVDKMRTWTVDHRGPTKMWTFACALLPFGPLYSKLTRPLCITKKWTHNKMKKKLNRVKIYFSSIIYHSIIKGGWKVKLKWRDSFC